MISVFILPFRSGITASIRFPNTQETANVPFRNITGDYTIKIKERKKFRHKKAADTKSAAQRVDKVDTLQVEISLRELSLDNKGLRSHGAHRASP